MTEFTDSSGRNWAIVLNLGSAKRVLEKTGVDLLNPAALVKFDDRGEVDNLNSLTTRLATDDILIGEIIAALLEKQAKERNISDEDLFDLFDGTTLLNAHSAFLKEYNAFFTARGNYPMTKATETMIERLKIMQTEKSLKDEKSTGETLSDSQDKRDSVTSTT